MQTSSQPKLLPVPFANGGSKQDIPNDSQIGITAGRASYTDGFPPLTRTPLAAGGVPPFGTDFNGVLNEITTAIRWSQAGAGYPFDATFNTAITGYPKGAKILNSTFDGFWLNTTDGNSNNPENTTSVLTGWVPYGFYGVTSISGLSGSSVTLTTLQAGRDKIVLSGTLTSNINVSVPAWIKKWNVSNNCTGNFSITFKTVSGSGIAIASGASAILQGDGINIIQDASPGSLLNIQTFTSSGNYTPTVGTKKIIVEAVGGGGGGGATQGNTSNQRSCASGGGAGGYGKSLYTSGFSSVAITIGQGGVGGTANSASNGGTGGVTSFGGLLVCQGGVGGAYASGWALPFVATSSQSGTVSGANLYYQIATPGTSAYFTANGYLSGSGASSLLGQGGAGAATGRAGYSATGYGSGGGGAVSGDSQTGFAGGNGSNGVVIIWEYA